MPGIALPQSDLMDLEAARILATDLANKIDTDIIFYTGPILRPYDAQFIDLCSKQTRRKNALLFLCSQGGDADAAYRLARCLQRKYETFTVVIGGWCKSAGTLLAIGANSIVMTDLAEFGPLDVQMGRKDELWESDSGLTVLTAIAKLEEQCFELFESSMFKLKIKSDGRITLKTATELAQKLAIGIISPVVSQIDPLHVGEVTRAMNIGLEYAERLAKKSCNVNRSDDPAEDAIRKLANGYPAHGFVIDREEASELFVSVREPTEDEVKVLEALALPARRPLPNQAFITYLSTQPAAETDNVTDSNQPAINSENAARGGETVSGTDQADSAEKPTGSPVTAIRAA